MRESYKSYQKIPPPSRVQRQRTRVFKSQVINKSRRDWLVISGTCAFDSACAKFLAADKAFHWMLRCSARHYGAATTNVIYYWRGVCVCVCVVLSSLSGFSEMLSLPTNQTPTMIVKLSNTSTLKRTVRSVTAARRRWRCVKRRDVLGYQSTGFTCSLGSENVISFDYLLAYAIELRLAVWRNSSWS